MSIGIEFYDLGKYLNAYIEEIEGRKTPIYYIYSKLFTLMVSFFSFFFSGKIFDKR